MIQLNKHNPPSRNPVPMTPTVATQQVNDFIDNTFLQYGGREALLSSVSNINNSAPIDDPLDSLASMMQDVEMSRNERIFWILLFSLMVLVAAGGNIVVIHIVSTNKEMKSVTNYFLVNLSLADTMVSTLNVIFNFISMVNSHWPFGNIYCKISNFIAILSISASVFTLTAISCDRYNAIIHPLRPRMSHRHAIGWILLIWTLSSALALPNLIYSMVVEDRLLNDNLALTCTMSWPDGRYPLSQWDHIYNIIIMVITYVIPILTMAILYYRVGKELWGHQAIGEDIEKQARAVMAKRKIVKMMIVVVIIFALCWLPYHGFFVVNHYLPTIFQDGPLYYQRCYLIMYWLAMSNSMYNPIIIYFMNSKFRHEFKRVLYFICCCRTYTPPPPKSGLADCGNQNQLYGAASGGGGGVAGGMHSAARLVSGLHAAAKRLNGNAAGQQPAASTVALTAGPRHSKDEQHQQHHHDHHRRVAGGQCSATSLLPSDGGDRGVGCTSGVTGAGCASAGESCGKKLTNQRQHHHHQASAGNSIEVIVTQSDELDERKRGLSTSNHHEREPFIKDLSSGGCNSASANVSPGSNSRIDLKSGSHLDGGSSAPKSSGAKLLDGREARLRSAAAENRHHSSPDKVWI